MHLAKSVLIASLLILALASWGCDRARIDADQPGSFVLRGTIVNTHGEAIPNGEIHLLWPKVRHDVIHSSSTTDAGGSFLINVPYDQALRVYVSATDHKSIEVPILVTESPKNAEFQVVLPHIDEQRRAQLSWSEELAYLTEMEHIRRTANAESAQVMRTLYELTHPELVANLGTSDLSDPSNRQAITVGTDVEIPGQPTYSHPLVRSFAIVECFRVQGRSAYLNDSLGMSADEVMMLAPHDSPVWGFDPNKLLFATFKDYDVLDNPKALIPLLQEVIDSNPDRLVQGEALALLVMAHQRAEDTESATEAFTRLERDFSDLRSLQTLIHVCDPTSPIRTGQRFPEFSFDLTDGTTFSSNDLKGRWTLIDLWSLRCGPCISDMPSLHLAHEVFQNRGLTILSVSYDQNTAMVDEFRAGAHPMPWLHAVPPEGQFDPNVKLLNPADLLPQVLLISPDGVIVATAEDLRRERLTSTLTRHLGTPDRPTEMVESLR